MNDPTTDPPLVTRADPPPAVVPAAPRAGMGLPLAVLWAVTFIAVQLCAAVLVVGVVFLAYTFAAPEPAKFVDEQLGGFTKAASHQGEGERPPVPFEFGQSLAWGMLAAQVASLALVLLVLPWRIGPDWKRQIGLRRPRGLHVLLVLMIVPGFIVTADLVQTLFVWATGLKPPDALKALGGVFGPFPLPLTVLAVAVGPGVVEELWCRGFLGRGLSRRYGLALGVVFTSVLFSAMHGDPSQFVVMALMGAYLHFVYLATRCIWMPILLHALNNGIAVFLALVIRPSDATTIPLVVYIAGAGLLVFGSVALWTGRASVEGRPDGTPWEAESPGISAPPEGAYARLVDENPSPAALMFALVSLLALVYLLFRFAR